MLDFTDDQGTLERGAEDSVEAFVALSALTPVLSNVWSTLYTVRNSPCLMSTEDALLHASRCQEQLNVWLTAAPFLLEQPGTIINSRCLFR